MPPTDEMRENALLCLSQLQVIQFSADKTSIIAGEGGVTISWEVKLPPGCHVSIQLNSVNVPRKSTRHFNPIRSLSFRLVARAAGILKNLGTIQVIVDASSCSQTEIPESTIATLIEQNVTTGIAEYNLTTDNKISERRSTQVAIEPSGIILRLRLSVDINNFWDPDIDIDAKIGVGVGADGTILMYYKSFSVDVDWPWFVTGLSLGISKRSTPYSHDIKLYTRNLRQLGKNWFKFMETE